jgi:hypothetical protein
MGIAAVVFKGGGGAVNTYFFTYMKIETSLPEPDSKGNFAKVKRKWCCHEPCSSTIPITACAKP